MPCLPINKATKFLGILCNPTNCFRDEFPIRLEQAKEFESKLQTSSLKPKEVLTAYQSIWLAKLRYFSPIVIFNDKQWNDLQKPVLNALLPNITINRKTPRHLIFAAIKWAGVGLTPFWVIQGYEKSYSYLP